MRGRTGPRSKPSGEKRGGRQDIPTSLEQLTSDTQNANKGTPRGRDALDQSLQQYGAGRSVLRGKSEDLCL